MHADHALALPDGRALTYAAFGRPDGAPVLYFHGAPSSRLEPLLLGDAWDRLGLRVIAPDRPGMGGSTFQLRRGFSDWPADVTVLADLLGLGRFAVLGNSGGAAYVAMCAARIPDRLTSAVVASGGWRMDWPEARAGLPLPNRVAMTLARRAPFLLRMMLSMMGGVAEGDQDKELAQLRRRLPPQDAAVFEAPGRLEAFAQAMREALKQGARGAAYDMGLYVRPFDFDPGEVRFPITWFHGEQDRNSPVALARRVAAELPLVRLVTFPDDAHLSTLCNHIDEIARALTNR